MSDRWWMARSLLLIGIAAAAVFGLLTGAIIWWQNLDLLNEGSQDGAKLIAAVIATVGSAITGAVALIGRRIQVLAEQRIQLDSAIKATATLVERPPSPDNQDTTREDIEIVSPAVLLALVRMNQRQLALQLLDTVWAQGKISPNAATDLVRDISVIGSRAERNWAASVFIRNAARASDGGHIYTLEMASLFPWKRLPVETRVELLRANLSSVIAWPGTTHNLGICVDFLVRTYRRDRNRTVRASIGYLLGQILEAADDAVFPLMDYDIGPSFDKRDLAKWHERGCGYVEPVPVIIEHIGRQLSAYVKTVGPTDVWRPG